MLSQEELLRRARERSRRWREANPKKVAEQRRTRGQRASISAKQNATERTKLWRVDNPEKARVQSRKDSRAYFERDPEGRRKQWRDSRGRHLEQSRRSVREGRYRKRAFLAEVVGAACVDCGDDRPGAVEYHHPGGKDKGQVPLTHLSWKKLEEEAMHLIALCGACHGVRHHKENSL